MEKKRQTRFKIRLNRASSFTFGALSSCVGKRFQETRQISSYFLVKSRPERKEMAQLPGCVVFQGSKRLICPVFVKRLLGVKCQMIVEKEKSQDDNIPELVEMVSRVPFLSRHSYRMVLCRVKGRLLNLYSRRKRRQLAPPVSQTKTVDVNGDERPIRGP